MAQLLTAPPSANLLAPIPDQGKDSNATNAASLEAETGAGATFASVLKTTSEKIQVRPGKQPSSTDDSSAPATSITASRILTSLHADASIKLKEPQRPLADVSADLTAPANLATTTLFIAPLVAPAAPAVVPKSLTDTQLLSEAAGEQSSALVDVIDIADTSLLTVPRVEAPFVKSSLSIDNTPREALAEALPEPLASLADQQPAIMTAAPAGLISAASPAPTFSLNKAGRFSQSEQKAPVGKFTNFLPEHGHIADKFAAKAAIAAETGKSVEMSFSKESGSGDFSTFMDRGVQTSALAAMSQSHVASGTAAPGLKLETPFGQAGWRDELGQKLTWMVSNTRQQAELVLNPPQLGRIEVTLVLDGDKASANFFSPHANVREALENSLVRLREVLAEAGVTLGQTNVGEDSRQNSSLMDPKHDERTLTRRNGDLDFSATNTAASGGPKLASIGRGVVDVFA